MMTRISNILCMATFSAACIFAAFSATSPTFAQEGEKGVLRWSFDTGGWIESPAIAADGTIYVGSDDKNLYALSPEGKRKWTFKTGGPIYSSPAIAADGTIYVGSYDRNLYALSPEGKRKWAFTGGDGFSTPALAADGTIYAENRDMKLYALTPEGKLKWSVDMKCDVMTGPSSPAPGADGTIYVGGCDNKLHAFTPEGKLKWASPVAGDAVLSSPALGADGTIYVANGDSKRSVLTLHAFTPQGELKWQFETQRGPPSRPQSPVIAPDGTIYYVADRLFALTPEGKRKWAFVSELVDSSPAIGADRTIYLVSWNGELYAITPDGTRKWSLETGGRVTAFPVLGADGTVYLGTAAGTVNKKNSLYAFLISSRGYAASSWPSDQARWMKHGGGQPGVEQAPAIPAAGSNRIATPAVLPADAGPQRVEATTELQKRGIPFAPERFVECAEVGDAACVKLFLDAGMKAQDEVGGAALTRALARGHVAVAEVLFENGANPDARSGQALLTASQFGRLDIVLLLLSKGANPNPHGRPGDTPLRIASYQGQVEVVRVLLEKGADPNVQGLFGTALRGASEFGYLEVVKMLLQKGANPDLREDVWWTATALMSASYNGHVEVVQAILEKGADLDLRDKAGRTALMVASDKGHLEIAKMLLQSGADIKALDSSGKTALAYAKALDRENRDRDAVIALLEAAAKK